MADKPICKIDGCGNPSRAQGFCVSHYKRLKRHGDPLGGGQYLNVRQKWIEENKDYSGDDCLTWPFGRNPNGYGQHKLNGRSIYASRAMCKAAHGEPLCETMQAAHSCGNGHLGCVNPRHLRWATRKENMHDAKLHGTWAHGERQGSAKLTSEQVLAIRSDDRTHSEIAADYGINRRTVGAIKLRRKWAWLE